MQRNKGRSHKRRRPASRIYGRNHRRHGRDKGFMIIQACNGLGADRRRNDKSVAFHAVERAGIGAVFTISARAVFAMVA